MLIAKKYFLFHGLNTKKAGLKRIRIAKKIHSSLLSWVLKKLLHFAQRRFLRRKPFLTVYVFVTFLGECRLPYTGQIINPEVIPFGIQSQVYFESFLMARLRRSK